jgi:hypothetical protein
MNHRVVTFLEHDEWNNYPSGEKGRLIFPSGRIKWDDTCVELRTYEKQRCVDRQRCITLDQSSNGQVSEFGGGGRGG